MSKVLIYPAGVKPPRRARNRKKKSPLSLFSITQSGGEGGLTARQAKLTKSQKKTVLKTSSFAALIGH